MKTRSPPPRSEWENIPGFDRVNREYIRLDCDAWITAHRIKVEGEKRGKRNQPSSNEKLPDEIYNKIESWVRKRALDCKEEVGKYIRDELASLHDLRSRWEEENPEIALDALVTQNCQNLESTSAQSVGGLDKQRAEFEEAARDLNQFRQNYGLSRIANYPSSQFAHWLWVPVLMIIETFAGANLLGSVSSGGVIEGWLIAIVLTIVNVFLGVCAGQVWRFTQYDWGGKKLLAYILVILCTAAVLFWNGIAGHIRDIYEGVAITGEIEPISNAFQNALYKMLFKLQPWESLTSAGLALVGVFVFVFTLYKSYTADDRFPGYGAKHRQAESLRNRYQDDLEDALAELKSERDNVNVAIEEFKDRYEMDRASWNATLDRLKMIVDDYSVNLRQYNKDLGYILAAYRDANLATRTTPSPTFFESEPTIDEDVIQPPKFPEPDRPEWGDISKQAEAGFERVKQVYGDLLKNYQMLSGVVDDYAEKAP